MDISGIIAALSGAFTGGGQAWQQQQALQRQQQQQDRLDRQEQERIAMAKQQADRQHLNDEQTDVNSMLKDIGPNGALTPDQYGRVDRAKLGYRTQVAPDEDLSHSLFTGLTPFGGMNVPMPQASVAPTAAERQAQQASDTEQKRLQTVRTGIKDPYEQQVFDANPKGYKPTVQSFMDAQAKRTAAQTENQQAIDNDVAKKKALGPIDTQQAVDRAVATDKATLPFKLQQTEGEERIRAKYKVPIPLAGAAGPDGQPAVNPTIKGIAEYKVQPPTPRSANYNAVMAEVLKYNPDYDATQFPTRQKMRTAYTSGPQGQTLGSLNTSILHLDHLADVAQAMGNGTLQPGNQLYNWWATQTGGSAPTNFEGAKDILAGELAGAFKRSGATDKEIEKVSSSLASKQSPQQVQDYITGVAIPMLAGKAQTSDEQYHAVMGAKDPFSVYTPSAKAVLEKWKKPAPVTPAATSPPTAVAGAGGAPAAPSIGTRGKVNGQPAMWDGHGWVAVQP